jgi:hypothetical protein
MSNFVTRGVDDQCTVEEYWVVWLEGLCTQHTISTYTCVWCATGGCNTAML